MPASRLMALGVRPMFAPGIGGRCSPLVRRAGDDGVLLLPPCAGVRRGVQVPTGLVRLSTSPAGARELPACGLTSGGNGATAPPGEPVRIRWPPARCRTLGAGSCPQAESCGRADLPACILPAVRLDRRASYTRLLL